MLTLYHGLTSVCSQKARLGLAEKGLDYESRLLDIAKGDQFDPAYMKLNPNAVVPTLVHDGKPVIESSVIIQYLDDVFPQNPLMPANDHEKALIRIWLLRTFDIHASINSMSYATAHREREMEKTPEEREERYRQIPSAFRSAKRRDLLENGIESLHVEAALDVLSRAASDMHDGLADGDWIVGGAFSLADVGLLSYFDRLYRLGMERIWTERYPRVADWYDRMRARPSYQTAIVAFGGGEEPKLREVGSRAWPAIAAKLNQLAA